MDPIIRQQYDITCEEFYIRPDITERKKSVIPTIILAAGLLLFFFAPLLLIGHKVSEFIALPLSFGGLLANLITGKICEKKDAAYNLMDCSFLVGLSMSDKATREIKKGYVFAEGYDLVNTGVASVKAMNTSDEFMLPKAKAKEEIIVQAHVNAKRKENARQVNILIHDANFQTGVKEAILANKDSYYGFNFTFFEKYRPLKKKNGGRFYAIPGYRGMETKILIPLDCGFEK